MTPGRPTVQERNDSTLSWGGFPFALFPSAGVLLVNCPLLPLSLASQFLLFLPGFSSCLSLAYLLNLFWSVTALMV